jgi:peptidoglycan/xylan/chitin deacetylase (PgdA/CDA1 family)
MNNFTNTLLRSIAFLGVLVIYALNLSIAQAGEKPFEHHMHMANDGVAITLDACSGGIDHRILDVLIQERIPATLFVTGRWLERNPETFQLFLAHPDLFQIEDHGAHHIPAVLGETPVYGIKPAGTLERIAGEISRGNAALVDAGARQSTWYRGATALYSPAAVPLIERMGYKIAGFSLNADYGASASAATAAKRISAAKNGDVVIAHINQPNRPAGAGIAAGLIELKERGVRFVLLKDADIIVD